MASGWLALARKAADWAPKMADLAPKMAALASYGTNSTRKMASLGSYRTILAAKMATDGQLDASDGELAFETTNSTCKRRVCLLLTFGSTPGRPRAF